MNESVGGVGLPSVLPDARRARRAAALTGFRRLNRELHAIAEAVRDGQLRLSDVGRAVASIPHPPLSEGPAFWSAVGTRVRHEHFLAWQDLAAAAPDALLQPINGYAQSIREAAVQAEFNTAAFERDCEAVEFLAARFRGHFPRSPHNRIIQEQAQRILGNEC